MGSTFLNYLNSEGLKRFGDFCSLLPRPEAVFQPQDNAGRVGPMEIDQRSYEVQPASPISVICGPPQFTLKGKGKEFSQSKNLIIQKSTIKGVGEHLLFQSTFKPWVLGVFLEIGNLLERLYLAVGDGLSNVLKQCANATGLESSVPSLQVPAFSQV